MTNDEFGALPKNSTFVIRKIRHLQSSSFPQFHHLQILRFTVFDRKTNDGAHFVKTFLATSTRIDVQQTQSGVGHHLENMGMAANEESRRIRTQNLPHSLVVLARIAADVGY